MVVVWWACTHSWGGAEIQHDFALLEEAILFVQLDQFEGSSGAVALLFGELVPLIETAFAVLLLDGHIDGSLLTMPGKSGDRALSLNLSH